MGKIPIETTKRIKVFELLNSFSPFFLPFAIITNSQPSHETHADILYLLQ